MNARPWELADADYDVVIVGGGMAGAGIARDLALRGLAVALLEKGDFASGTTSLSSKLIHGGLRYLELFDFGLVRESLRERARLERLAPHLVRPLPFLVPIYRDSSRGLVRVRVGLRVYDWLTPGRRRERYRLLRPVDALSLEPAIRSADLRGAGYYVDDLLVFPERLCLENVLSACRHGARAFNYAQVEELLRDARGQVAGVRARDLLGGGVARLGARVVVNATGPWVDELRARVGVRERGPRLLRRTKGIHCLLPRLTERAVYHSTRDDRMVFVLPWREFSLVGTTDTDFDGDPDRVHATREEVEYLLGEARHAVDDPRVHPREVLYTYAGVRPLSHEEGKRASDVSRAHKVVAEAGGRFLSVTGTKLTCFRSLAEEVGDAVTRALGRAAPGRTAELTLDGADEAAGRVEARTWMDVSGEAAASGLARETLETLVATYGRAWGRVVELAGKVPGGADRLCPHNAEVAAQLHHAVSEELTVSLQDFLLRRTGIGTSRCQGEDCAEAIAGRLAALL
ncbi:MAG TPA: glycerol-3-phosphate dehydrogenase/oxidase, partial [Methylomirabilota bacterium]|nr:glycerol-3-phosphate dehydrogenase/oxidase [Methylomirabilota bacterium]